MGYVFGAGLGSIGIALLCKQGRVQKVLGGLVLLIGLGAVALSTAVDAKKSGAI